MLRLIPKLSLHLLVVSHDRASRKMFSVMLNKKKENKFPVTSAMYLFSDRSLVDMTTTNHRARSIHIVVYIWLIQWALGIGY